MSRTKSKKKTPLKQAKIVFISELGDFKFQFDSEYFKNDMGDLWQIEYTMKDFIPDFEIISSIIKEFIKAYKDKKRFDNILVSDTEAVLHFLITVGFQDENIINTIKSSLKVCLNKEKLYTYLTSYPWYMACSRSLVTKMHCSKEGIPYDVLKFVNELKIESPSLVFALSPTTLHNNSLIIQEVSDTYSCKIDNISKESYIKSTYGDVIDESSMKQFTAPNSNRVTKLKALERLTEFTKILDINNNAFPWKHPTIPKCGCVIAGGLISGIHLSENVWSIIQMVTDVDIFVYGRNSQHRIAMVKLIAEYISNLTGFVKFSVFKSVIKARILKAPEIQIICPLAYSPLGVLINFDSTFIQIAYDGNDFICTPGYAHFTPLNKSLLTRYNLRFFRLVKMLNRGFMPVADFGGHLLYPIKLFFSNKWKLHIKKPLRRNTQQWEIKVFNEKKIPEVRELELDKPDLIWHTMELDGIDSQFDPDGATLQNGFDIYTNNVNSILPIPQDGKTEGLYRFNVLLRNIKICDSQKYYNLASSKEEPLIVEHVEFSDSRNTYPGQTYCSYTYDAEPVRTIEGIFLFEDIQIPEDELKEIQTQKDIVLQRNDKFYLKGYRETKSSAFRKDIKFEDLHDHITEIEGLKTMPVEEIGFMIDAFSKGDVYNSSNGPIYKADGMVKIRTVISFNPCMLFDVDDLLLNHTTLDSDKEKTYNAVVHLSNLSRWILEVHKHEEVMTFSDDRDMIIAYLREHVKPEIYEGEDNLGVSLSAFMRAIKHASEDPNFYEKSAKIACLKPHRDEGLLGEMPVLFCTRMYVTHNIYKNIKETEECLDVD